MSKNCRLPRGTHDVFGDELVRYRHVTRTGEDVAALYGFEEWITPIFEETRLFQRSLGETSDVVSKEMYNFEDRSGTSLTLRPEGTASVVRALISNGLTQNLPQKVFYCGPMFRYERPQKGRYRQFTQFGVENIGAETAFQDAETIAMARDFLARLGLDDVELQINTLGDKESRDAWRAALVEYFSQYVDELSEDSRTRLQSNPLRILDSKSEQDKKIAQNAPALESFLTPDARRFWEELKSALDAFGVRYVHNPAIVRGLDYYSHTAFEFVTDRLGAQGTVLGGGRYEGLVEELGGKPAKAIGWAAGVERLAELIEMPETDAVDVYILPKDRSFESEDPNENLEKACKKTAYIASRLRNQDISVVIDQKGKIQKRWDRAMALKPLWIVEIPENEEGVVVRHLAGNGKLEARETDRAVEEIVADIYGDIAMELQGEVGSV